MPSSQSGPSEGVSQSVFRQSRPVLITSLVNKAGSIGLSLLPMLLVDGRYSTEQSSLAMGLVKASMIGSNLASGWAADSLGLRKTVLASFLLAGLGLAFLPLQWGFAVLLVSGVVAQAGITSINTSLRLLLARTVERRHQKEALGWMRTTNNLGQVLSFGLASLSAGLGAMILIWFDSLTSFIAFAVGWRLLPKERAQAAAEQASTSPGDKAAPAARPSSWWPFLGCAFLLAGWNFQYEFFMDGVAGKLKVLFPEEGLRYFSLLMVVNTVLCALLAVKAARLLSRAVASLSIGAVLTAAGVFVTLLQMDSVPILFLGILLLTAGEVLFGVFAQFLLIRSVPPSRRENSIYSGATLLANVVRMAGAALAFPLIVHADDLTPAKVATVAIGAASLFILFLGRRRFHRLAEE